VSSFITQPGMVAGTDYSQLSASGAVSLNGASLRLSDGEASGCQVLTPGNVDTLLRTSGPLTGTFNGIPDGTTVALECFGAGEAPTVKINYTANTVTATVQTAGIRGEPTTTTLHVSNSSPLVGETVTYTATVTPATPGKKAPSGSVFFEDNGVPIATCLEQPLTKGASSSTATCQITYAAAGSHAITAFYTGDASFLESEAVPQTVDVHAAASSGESPPSESTGSESTGSESSGSGSNDGGAGAGGTAGSGTVLASATANISAAQVAALLGHELIPSGKRAKVAAVLKSNGFSIAFKALEAGTAVIDWYLLPPGARLAKAKAKPVLVASGRLAFSAAGTATMKVRLTAAGRRMLKHANSIKLTAKGIFVPAGKAPVVTTRAFVLRH
jgi:hypothetical protein